MFTDDEIIQIIPNNRIFITYCMLILTLIIILQGIGYLLN